MKNIYIIICIFFSLPIHAQNSGITLLRKINAPESSFLNHGTKFFSESVTPFTFAVPLAHFIFEKGSIKKKNSKSWYLAASALTAATITTTIKYSVRRERPFITYPDLKKRDVGGSPSFPSGHTSSSFALATSLTLAYKKWYVAVPAYVWASGVAYSRMYQGVHYPGDVLAGAIIGSGSAWLCYYIQKKLFVK